MRNITNREEANFFYKKINEVIDEYIKNWKIKPTEIYHYFNRNMDSFLEEIGLSDVNGIKKVVNDVLSHKKNMELDSVLTFESFNLKTSESTLEYEKILGDYYNVGLGHIDLVEPEINLFRVKDFGKSKFVSCFNKADIELLTKEILENLLNSTNTKSISLGVEETSVKFWLSEVLDIEKFKNIIDLQVKDNLFFIIGSKIKSNPNVPSNLSDIKNFEFKDSFIFEIIV